MGPNIHPDGAGRKGDRVFAFAVRVFTKKFAGSVRRESIAHMQRGVGTAVTSALLVLAGCGGPYGQHGRYAKDASDQAALGPAAYGDLAPVRAATDYDAITDFAVECVAQTSTAERLAAELVALPGDAYGARDALRKRTQDAATRCLSACPRVQNASSSAARDRALGEKYGPRCEGAFGHGALQLSDGERAYDRAKLLLADKNYLEGREAVMEVEACLKALGGESSARQNNLGKKLMALRAEYGGVLIKAESFARDPWVAATRGRLRAIASERTRTKDAARLSDLSTEEADLTKQLYERRQRAGI